MKGYFIFLMGVAGMLIFTGIKSMAQPVPYRGGSMRYQQLVWNDEFNYDGLPDSSKWNYENGYIRNHELQYYTTARLQNTFVHKGLLSINALNDSLQKDGKVYPITSGSLVTLGKRSWQFGRIEVRAKLPQALGTWPAIWMLGQNIKQVGWPACGEIDIIEHVGYMPDTMHFNAHTKKYNHIKKTGKGSQLYYPQPFNDYHVYAIEWFKDRIDWYFDDKKVFTFKNEGTGNDSWPFDKPQYLIVNVAFGGAWGGLKGVEVSTLPQSFLIDYVRVYQ